MANLARQVVHHSRGEYFSNFEIVLQIWQDNIRGDLSLPFKNPLN
jgi:hypothetical protein